MYLTTEQEHFWAGEFGNEYALRNQGATSVAANVSFFSDILKHASGICSVLEFGPNIGMNLMAMRSLLPATKLSAVEINERAASALRSALPDADVQVCSILDYTPMSRFDLVFTKGVLIHINPDKLAQVYDLMHATSARYILVAEYCSPRPVEVSYRGHTGKLFKRDFGGEMLDRFPDLELAAYGFAYHRDPLFPQDDITWFLLRKTLRHRDKSS